MQPTGPTGTLIPEQRMAGPLRRLGHDPALSDKAWAKPAAARGEGSGCRDA